MIAENITWGQFAATAGTAAAVYYLYLVVTGKIKLTPRAGPQIGGQPPQPPPAYQPAGTKRVWNVQEMPIDQQGPAAYQLPDEDDEEAEEDDHSFQQLESLAMEVQEIISQGGETISKEDLLQAIKAKITLYPTLNQPAFRAAISNIIIKAAKIDCLLDITKAETEALWGQP